MLVEVVRLLLRVAVTVLLLWAPPWNGGFWHGVALIFAIQMLINLTPRKEFIAHE